MTGYYTYMDNKGGYNNAGKVVEVLAPAGSLDICKAVINAGADAVYLGGDMFGARAYAGNLNQEEMFEALDYAHKLDRHIYLTVNTLLKQNEIEGQLIDYIASFYERGLDAVIVQDLGVMRLIRQNFPDMDIHASTQMTQTGVEGAGLLYKAGAVRVVTSREMTLGEIKKLHEAYPDMEIESFVHGAMCYCYSGQCLMSSFNGGRSGNRGRCAQPCRLPYKVYDGQNIINNQDEKYALSPKDMCALKILPDVIDAGVYSLKIEGRMKNVTYAAYVTSIYRKYVDKYIANGRKGYRVSDKDIEQLCDIYNRGAFTTGFYDTGKGRDMMALTRPNHWGVKALQVVSNVKGKITFKALTDINRQDVFEIDKEHSFESGSDIKKGQTMVVNLPKKYDLAVGKVLNRMKNAYLTELVKKSYVDCNTCISVDIYFKALKGEKAELTISSKDVYVTVYDYDPDKAALLLDEAGWTDSDGDGIREKDGTPLEKTMLNTSEYGSIGDGMLAIASQLGKVGFKVDVSDMDMMTYYGASMNGEYDIIHYRTYGGSFDPFTIVTIMDPAVSADPVAVQFAAFLPEGIVSELDCSSDENRINEIYKTFLTTIPDEALCVPFANTVELAAWNSEKINGYEFCSDSQYVEVSGIDLK